MVLSSEVGYTTRIKLSYYGIPSYDGCLDDLGNYTVAKSLHEPGQPINWLAIPSHLAS